MPSSDKDDTNKSTTENTPSDTEKNATGSKRPRRFSINGVEFIDVTRPCTGIGIVGGVRPPKKEKPN